MAELRRPTSIPGYEHPDTNSYSSKHTSVYKTFTEGIKAQKNEEFNSTNTDKQYAVYNEENTEKEKCPICKKEAIILCHCNFNDKECENKHIWYTNRDGKVQIGNPH